MKYIPLAIKTNYELMNSLIKIDDLILFAKDNNINALGIVDSHMFSCMEFYNKCINNNIKPILGLEVKINDTLIYIYAKNYNGYTSLCKIVSNKMDIETIKNMEDIKVVVSYKDYNLYSKYFDDVYIYYSNEIEKKNAIILSKNIVYLKLMRYFKEKDSEYINYLEHIKNNKTIDDEFNTYNDYYVSNNDSFDIETTYKFISDIDIVFPISKMHIPKVKDNSFEFLMALSKKGLHKRLNGDVSEEYKERLISELNTINDMGFTDYFLIVYDIVLYASKHNIFRGPGRGSAAGSLVSYSLGICSLDPLKYGLLFERFLNKDRITMPDIDMDFDAAKRNELVEYVTKKYGSDRVSRIISFNSLNPKQVLRDVGKVLKIDSIIIDRLCKTINMETTFEDLKDNREFNNIIKRNDGLYKLIDISSRLCGLKKSTSIHAAGVVISDIPLFNMIPLYYNGEYYLTGYTKDYIEELGLLKMDFLSLDDLTLFFNILNDIHNDNIVLNIDKINLDDKKTFELFSHSKTDGIFQFKTPGMKKFLNSLKPTSFNDLVDAVALYRKATKDMIPLYIERRNDKNSVKYLIPELESILKETYGIIIYQEQVLEILKTICGYSYSKADIIRRAMSKKKMSVIHDEKDNMIRGVLKLGYTESIGNELYELILKFSEYGFNKSHSVSYAYLSYQIAYLKANYPLYFIKNILNTTSSKEIVKSYIKEAILEDVKIIKPDINTSSSKYEIKDSSLVIPFTIISGINTNIVNDIIEERNKKLFISLEDFMVRVKLDKKNLISLIECGCFDSFNINKRQTIMNIDSIIKYVELIKDTSSMLIPKPLLEEYDDFSIGENTDNEIKNYGFFLSNHPVMRFNRDSFVKLDSFKKFFGKRIKIVLLVDSIKEYTDKNSNQMAFLNLSDEFETVEGVIFSSAYKNISIKKGKVYLFLCEVTRRYSEYQLTVIEGKELQ